MECIINCKKIPPFLWKLKECGNFGLSGCWLAASHEKYGVIANQPAGWCGDPLWRCRAVYCCKSTHFGARLQFSTNEGSRNLWGIATPVCALARNDSSIYLPHNPQFTPQRRKKRGKPKLSSFLCDVNYSTGVTVTLAVDSGYLMVASAMVTLPATMSANIAS